VDPISSLEYKQPDSAVALVQRCAWYVSDTQQILILSLLQS
jgi:hypothetical protein